MRQVGIELVPAEAELAQREGRSYELASALLAKINAKQEDVGPRRSPGDFRTVRDRFSFHPSEELSHQILHIFDEHIRLVGCKKMGTRLWLSW